MVNETNRTVAVLGGTGNLGFGLARRLALAGYSIVIGSRDAARAASCAAELSAAIGTAVRGAGNRDAATQCDMVIVAVPWDSQEAILNDIRSVVGGKIVIDTTVPLQPPKVMRVQLPPDGSAAQRAQRLLGENVTLVSAFHNVAAKKLASDDEVDCDVLVFGDDKDARKKVLELVKACRLRGLEGGSLANSAAAEALTSVLIFLNKQYSVEGAGLRITGNLRV